MRSFSIVPLAAVAALAAPGAVRGHAADASHSSPPTVRAAQAQALTISDLRVQRRAPGGRVRGNVVVSPVGMALRIVVRRGARPVGHRTVIARDGRTSFSVRIDRASRARLRRVGHLDLQVKVSASGPGTNVSTSRSARVIR